MYIESNDAELIKAIRRSKLSVFHWMFLIMFFLKLDGSINLSWWIIILPMLGQLCIVISDNKKKKDKE